jgi:hypothetical protein
MEKIPAQRYIHGMEIDWGFTGIEAIAGLALE